MKVVVNKCFGGFGLSERAYEFLGLEWDGYGYKYNDYDLRTDAKLIECVETLGEKADGRFARLVVVDIPEVEAMAAVTVLDLLLTSMTARMDLVKEFFSSKR